MEYIGLHSQIARNNRRSVLLLLAFPTLILGAVYAILYFGLKQDVDQANGLFIRTIPIVLGAVAIWFLIAYFSHSAIIKATSGAETLERKDNMRVYNLTENLCMSIGMQMPKLYVIESPALNAFASGIDKNSFAVTLTTGIIETLDDRELEGVIAHELTHIRNKDVRLLIISIIFVGIFAFTLEIIFRTFLHGGRRRDKSDGKLMLIALLVAVVVYVLSILFKFSLSRKREYLADAGAVELTKNSHAMASALRKISGNHELDVKGDDLKQAFIENTPKDSKGIFSALGGLFSTHPPIEKRIEILEKGL